MKLFNLSTLAAVAFAVAPLLAAPGKKYIGCGYEFRCVTPANVLSNAAAFAETPLDGIGMWVYATNAQGKAVSTWSDQFMGGVALDRDALSPLVADFRAIGEETTLKHCFLYSIMAPPFRLRWDDDAAWGCLSSNMAALAWFARETGMKRFIVDPEDYRGQGQTSHRPDIDPPLDECVKLARRRGAEVFGAAFRECPDLKVLFFWLLSRNRRYYSGGGPAVRLPGDLWPAFVDGILDVIPPEAQLIDGDEWGYFYSYDTRDFHEGAYIQTQKAKNLLSPENRAKYAAHIVPSFGIFLDRYIYPGGGWYAGPVAGSRLERLRRNMADATECAGEYVWFWGEHRQWIAWTKDVKMPRQIFEAYSGLKAREGDEPFRWEDWIPGVNETLRLTKDFEAGCAERMEGLRAAGALTNLVAHGDFNFPGLTNDFTKGVPAPFKGIYTYNNGGRMGVDRTAGENDSSSVLFEGVRYSVLTFCRNKDVKPGEVYAFEVSAKSENMGAPHAYISWRGTGDVSAVDVKLGEPDANGWRRGIAFFKVPLSLDHVWAVVQVMQRGDAAKKVWIDNFALYRLWP